MVILLAAAFSAMAQAPVIQVVKQGAQKDTVSLDQIRTAGPKGRIFVNNLTRDLELSGWYRPGPGGGVKIAGGISEGGDTIRTALTVTAPGKRFEWSRSATGDKAIRACAHALSDAIVEHIAGEKGFAQTKITFVNRLGRNKADLYICDANGMGASRITHDNVACVGPRWAPNGEDIYYTSFKRGYPEIFRFTPGNRTRQPLASFRGLNTGAAVSPDGKRVALILSYQGNPELYVLNKGNGFLLRMTKTPRASEASPCWSPDGGTIVYVSDVTGKPQLYAVDVRSRRSRRITFQGSENVSPDFSCDGQLAWISKRSGGNRVYRMQFQSGEGSAQAVDAPWGAEDPSWAVDNRHLVCHAGGALYILDTMGDEPVRLFSHPGNWMSPDWSKPKK